MLVTTVRTAIRRLFLLFPAAHNSKSNFCCLPSIKFKIIRAALSIEPFLTDTSYTVGPLQIS